MLVDLPAAAARLRLARALVPRLAAAVRALYVRLVIGSNGGALQRISSHWFFVKGVSDVHRTFVAMHLPLHLAPVSAENSLAARAAVQRLFVACPSRLVITRAASPRKTWAALMSLEAVRPIKAQPPQYLPRAHTMSPVDVSFYRMYKELPVAPYPARVY